MRKSRTTNYFAINYEILAATENGSKGLRQVSTQKKLFSDQLHGEKCIKVSTDHKAPLNTTVNDVSTKISPLEEERLPGGQIDFWENAMVENLLQNKTLES